MPSSPDAATLGHLLTHGAGCLARAGIDAPAREARLLLALATGLPASTVLAYPERIVPDAAAVAYEHLLSRRSAREPLSRILGRREFWSLDLALGPDTLDPRPDSETIVEAALATVMDRAAPLRLLDLGTGSGCLLLALLSELPNATGLGIDLSPGAAALAAANAAALGLSARATFLVADWTAAIPGRSIDLVVSNPPYIESAVIAGLEPEVRDWDPRRALDGGTDGLDAYRRILADLGRILRPDGRAVLELGTGQATAVTALAKAAGLDVLALQPDLGGIDRALTLGWARHLTEKRVGTPALRD